MRTFLLICLCCYSLMTSAQSAEEWNEKAAVKAISGELDSAIYAYTKAIDINPSYFEALRGRAATYLRNEAYSLAIADCNRALKIKSNDGDLYYIRGTSKYSLGDFYGCISDLSNQWVSIDKELLYFRGVAKKETKNYHGAIKDFDLAIQLDNEFGSAYFHRGICKWVLNKKKEGCRDLSKAGELGVEQAYGVINEFCY